MTGTYGCQWRAVTTIGELNNALSSMVQIYPSLAERRTYGFAKVFNACLVMLTDEVPTWYEL